MLRVITFAILVLAAEADYVSETRCTNTMIGYRLPHLIDCAKFVICTNTSFGLARNCPNGLHFNADNAVCDYPSQAGCSKERTSGIANCECDCSLCYQSCTTETPIITQAETTSPAATSTSTACNLGTSTSPTQTDTSPTSIYCSPPPTHGSPTTTEACPAPTDDSSVSTEVFSTPNNGSPTPNLDSSTPTNGSPTTTAAYSTPIDGSPSSTEGSPTTTGYSSTPTDDLTTTTECSSAPTSGSSTASEASPTPTDGSPTPTEGSSTPTDDSSASTEDSSTPTNHSPTTTEVCPTPTDDSSTPTETSPIPTNCSPSSTEGSFTPTDDSPTPTNGSPTPTEGSSTSTSGSPTPTEASPAPTDGSPTSTEGSPTPTDDSSASTGDSSTPTNDSPTTTEACPTPTDDSSTPTEASPIPTNCSPTSTEGSSTPTDDSPTPTNGSPAPTEGSSTSTSSSPTPTEASPAPTDGSPTSTEGSPTPTDDSSASTGDSSTPTNDSSTPTETSPIPTNGSPTSTEGSSTPTDDSPTPTNGSRTPTEGSSTSTSGSPTPTEASPAPTDGSPTSTEGSPTPTDDSSASTGDSSTPTNDSPTTTEACPTPTDDSSTPTEASPIPTNCSPTSTEGSSTPTDDSPTPTNGSPTPTEDSSTSTSGSPTPTEASPAPTDGSPTPTEGSSTPTDDSSASTGDSSTPTNDSPTPTAASPTPTNGSPTSTEDSSTPTDDSPTPTNGSPTPTEGSSTSTSGSPTPTEASPAPTDGSPTPTEGSSTPTDDSSASTGDSSTPTNDSPTPTEASPIPTNCSPTSTEGSFTPTDDSPTPTNGSPTPTEGSSTSTSGSPTPTEASPAPTDGSPTPTEGSSTPTDDSSASTGDSSTPTNDSPTPTAASPTPTNGSPTSTEDSSTPTDDSPTPTNGSPTPTESSSTPTDVSSPPTEAIPTPTNGFPTYTEDSSRPTDDSPTPTNGSPTPTGDYSTPTDSSPTIPEPTGDIPDCDPTCCNRKDGVTIVMERDCQKFIVCVGGKENIFTCSNNLQFNSLTGECDYPENVNCSTHQLPPSGPSAGPSGTYCETGGRCVGQRDGTSFANKTDECSSDYVICQCECEVKRSCPSQLMFNVKLGICDWPTSFVTLLAVVALTTLALCSGADPECKYRKIRKLALHWADPTDCTRYYRCTNKSVKREVICAEGKAYNAKIGKCSTNKSGLCKLTLAAPLEGVVNPCADEVSGVYMAQTGYCRNFYICNNNEAYPQVCDAGSLFNTTTGNCIPDTASECWQNKCIGETNGTYLPDAASCTSFYVCAGGEATAQVCNSGSYFNSSSRVCQPDPSGEYCWENVCVGKKDGDYVKDINDCYSYYVCAVEKPVQQYCPEGSYFNWLENVCLPGKCPSDESSTESPTTATTISSTECSEESTESSSSTECSTTATTISSTECSEESTESSSTSTECSTTATTISSTECREESTESSSSTESTEVTTSESTACPEVTTPAPEADCSCPGGYKEGELVPFPNYPENCDKYYVCFDGKLQERECGTGNSFNSSLGVCVRDTDNICWPADCNNQVEDTMVYRSRRSIVVDVADETSDTRSVLHALGSPNCLGLYAEGEVVTHPKDCRKYLICASGEMISRDCGLDNYFDPNTLTCSIDTQQACDSNGNYNRANYEESTDAESNCSCPGGYKDGELVPFPNYPQNCDKYYECSNGKLQEKECGVGNLFNSILGVCVPDTDHICWPTESTECPDATTPATTTTTADCTCPGGYKEGELLPFPNYPENCAKYYICSSGRLQERDCGIGNRFDNKLGVCVVDTDNTCWPNVCKDQPDGTALADPTNCTSFYLCEGGQGEVYECPNEKWFNPNQQICMPDFNATCINPCKDTTGITFLPNPDCSKYFLCNDGRPYVETCPQGGFDINLGKCHGDAVCESTLCLGKDDGFTWPVAGNDTKFYVCLGGVAQINECSPGSIYKTSVGVCLEQPSPQCDQNKCNSSTTDYNAFAPLNGTDDTAFCMCRDGEAFLHHCADNYTFRADLGICYSNAPCDPDLCDVFPENTRSPNRNDTHSFCLCVSKQQVIVDCPNNQTYNPVSRLCQTQDDKCSATFCLSAPEYSIFPALNNDTNGFCMCIDSSAVYKLCEGGKKFNVTKEICLSETEDACNDALCAGNAGLIFGAVGDSHSFCYCVTDGVASKRSCPNSETFNDTLLICQAVGCDGQVCLTNPTRPFPAFNEPYSYCTCTSNDPNSVTKHNCSNGTRFNTYDLTCKEDPCDKSFCSNVSNDGIPYPANNFPQGFCICNDGVPELYNCSNGSIFNSTIEACISPTQLQCDLSKCANATTEYTYPVAAKNDSHGFCYCFSATEVEFFTCPGSALFDPIREICDVSASNCTCPGDYKEGQLLPNPTNCRLYYVCSHGRLQELDCGAGKYFNKLSAECQVDTAGACVEKPDCTCVGAYREGEFVPHHTSNQLYYICYNSKLMEGDCGAGNFFDKDSLSCQSLDRRRRQMRSEVMPDYDRICMENDKQSVPSNCSQYEICIDSIWIRLSCPDERYYNLEQRKCMEPRDDMTCTYARVKNLPVCSAAMEQRTVPGKESNCAQYYRCNHGKWRLKTCPKQHFYSTRLKTCIPSAHDDACVARNESKIDIEVGENFSTSPSKCRHMTVRHFEQNCAMYLMCLEGKWWHQYCPLGMYYNRTHNYCMPNINGQCDTASNAAISASLLHEYSVQSCDTHGALRPSALSCDHYYECQAGYWELKKCAPHEYFNATENMCLSDKGGVCAQLHTYNSYEGKRREFPFNCTAYEICIGGEWKRASCNHSWMFDNILHICVPNDGSCAENGLRRACVAGETKAHPSSENCTQFFYCLQDSWKEGTCLKGHTYAKELGECVPHSAYDKCQPLFIKENVKIALGQDLGDQKGFGSNRSDLCLEREDGSAVPHPESCLHFFVCLAKVARNKQKCVRGSFFDAKLGYCRPNDGSCLVPLGGICANASDGAYVPHPEDCRGYYHCSTLNGTELLHCPEGEYYHNATSQCRIDQGECRAKAQEFGKCTGVEHGKRLPHERYCNIYYACVRGLAIPVACPADHQFSAAVGNCIFDEILMCENVTLSKVLSNVTISYSCGNLTDGIHLPDIRDCTKYYVCSAGTALTKTCPTGAFFDAEQRLCVPDDGSCPYIVKYQPNQQSTPPDPAVCEGEHGLMLPDPVNCNEFYVCINGKLRHERCNISYFFSTSRNECQPYETNIGNITEEAAVSNDSNQMKKVQNVLQCIDKPTNYTKLCSKIPRGTSIAEQSDCRRYINCNDAGEPVPQRCRNGESYDSLFGFCRQNDGTCLLENGQRVGECKGFHGQQVRDVDNCRGYFVCINGQKIVGECSENEYFDKVLSACLDDVNNQCGIVSAQSTESQVVSCVGLSDSTLYPYTPDNCRSYFQCVHGKPNVHECADGLYFNASITRCVKDITECAMPTASLKRAPELDNHKVNICEKAKPGERYANINDHCHSSYVCGEDGSIAYTTCPAGELYNDESGICEIAINVICKI
ncbi:uncharacterized protein LOC128861972 [Anastrepha ludens]|uniref:uncharacterized protein LOC128861972 n=1 Tax=Anastrepha ludens TaxID=28586 RepID=UPI0023AF428B|nr:uncharacterized protein LOC128861972 [Anastrepha ludens]